VAIDWQSVKDDYEKRGVSIRGLGCRYGCSPETVRRRVAGEGWIAGPEGGAGCGVSLTPEDGLSGALGFECGGRSHSTEGPDAHIGLWLEVKRRLARALTFDDAGRCLEELKAAKMAGEVLSTVVKGKKEAEEHSEGGLTDIYEEAEELVREMEAVTVPPDPGQALEG
jgi:hypothetical protein